MPRIENCLGTCEYITSNCVLILAVNVNFQIELDSPIFKANFNIHKIERCIQYSTFTECEGPDHSNYCPV